MIQETVPLGPSNLQNRVGAAFVTPLLFSRHAVALQAALLHCLLPASSHPVTPHRDAASACAPAQVPNSSGSTVRWIQTKGEFKSESFVRAIKVRSWELPEPEVGYMSVKLFILP